MLKDDPAPILLVTPTWGRDGGVATHVKASASALAGHGLDVHVLAAQLHCSESIAGVTVHHEPNLLNKRLPAKTRFGDCMSSPPTVTHFHQLDDQQLVTQARGCAPVVISAHVYPGCTSGVYYFSPGQECKRAHGPGCIPNLIGRGCAHTRYPRTLPRKYRNVTRGLAMLASADLVVSYSSAVDRHLAANDLPARTIVPLFPTMRVGANSPPASHPGRVLFAGRVEQPKGLDVLIRAIGELECELVVCGDGRQLDSLRRLADDLGVRERVHFAGWLAPEQLAAELAAATVVAVPSLWPEPFGLVGIEALAAGRPVVASATGGIVDWLQDDVGVRVPAGDAHALARALGQLLSDPERQLAMGAAGRRLVAERFSAERHVQALLDAYRTAHAAWSYARPPQTAAVSLTGARR